MGNIRNEIGVFYMNQAAALQSERVGEYLWSFLVCSIRKSCWFSVVQSKNRWAWFYVIKRCSVKKNLYSQEMKLGKSICPWDSSFRCPPSDQLRGELDKQPLLGSVLDLRRPKCSSPPSRERDVNKYDRTVGRGDVCWRRVVLGRLRGGRCGLRSRHVMCRMSAGRWGRGGLATLSRQHWEGASGVAPVGARVAAGLSFRGRCGR